MILLVYVSTALSLEFLYKFFVNKKKLLDIIPYAIIMNMLTQRIGMLHSHTEKESTSAYVQSALNIMWIYLLERMKL